MCVCVYGYKWVKLKVLEVYSQWHDVVKVRDFLHRRLFS